MKKIEDLKAVKKLKELNAQKMKEAATVCGVGGKRCNGQDPDDFRRIRKQMWEEVLDMEQPYVMDGKHFSFLPEKSFAEELAEMDRKWDAMGMYDTLTPQQKKDIGINLFKSGFRSANTAYQYSVDLGKNVPPEKWARFFEPNPYEYGNEWETVEDAENVLRKAEGMARRMPEFQTAMEAQRKPKSFRIH